MGSINNKINAKENKEHNKYKSAFSLIELSIVLIIIGLLVAGVTGGKSLIDSARLRAFANELEDYKKTIFTSLALNDRLPGDLDNDGWMGSCYVFSLASNYSSRCLKEIYTTSSFPAPYNTSTTTPNNYSAPFVDLELNGIADYGLEKNDVGKVSLSDSTYTVNKGLPFSRIFKNNFFYFQKINSTTSTTSFYLYNIKFGAEPLYIQSLSTENDSNPSFFKRLDEKIDDGIYNSGNFRGRCVKKIGSYTNDDYDTSIKNNFKHCGILYLIK